MTPLRPKTQKHFPFFTNIQLPELIIILPTKPNLAA